MKKMRLAAAMVAMTVVWGSGCKDRTQADPLFEFDASGAAGTVGAGGIANMSPAGGGSGSRLDPAKLAGAGAGGVADVPSVQCEKFGDVCASSGDCCSGLCSPNTFTCASVADGCAEAGVPCGAATDCCSLRCSDGGTCSTTACLSDDDACGDGSECCSGTCDGGACASLNLECKTAGNTCSNGAECCSQLCGEDGRCDIGASFCTQSGDLCGRNAECCTGLCQVADGATLGTCAPPPAGATNCSGGVDGSICDVCGQCCSRLCAPFGDSGLSVCQPASGCHVNGDLCRNDTDCCGGEGSGLPGDGNVVCDKEEGAQIGICRNPRSCNPQGNVCHFQDYACSNSSSRNNCCAGMGSSGLCQLDALGVPRCNGLGDTCREASETCSSAADCCNDLPCVPDDERRLRCTVPDDTDLNCIARSGRCTINADCCPGAVCLRATGSTQGTCGNLAPPGNPGVDPVPSDAGGGSGGPCSVYGQACETATDCCGTVPCTLGACVYPAIR